LIRAMGVDGQYMRFLLTFFYTKMRYPNFMGDE
jgi:hypothetical protein